MGVDVYTPAYDRMTELPEHQAAEVRMEAWRKRPTVEQQEQTEEDWLEYNAIQAIFGRLEKDAGHFRHRTRFDSSIEPIATYERGEECSFQLTHGLVEQYLVEWRAYLRELVSLGGHLEKWVNGLDEPVPSPFDEAVYRFKSWCRVYQLGEGCYVA
jgi:hypothetical protein